LRAAETEEPATQPGTGAKHVEAGAKQEGSGANQREAETQRPEAEAGWENPLIPNARLRQIYLAMTRARTLEKALRAARRGRAVGLSVKGAGTLGLEACLVSAAADLGPGDLVSDALAGGVVDFLRGAAVSDVMRPGRATVARRDGGSVRGLAAECGAAARLPGAADGAERMWTALGAAAVLKAAAAQARAEAKAVDAAARQAGVVVIYSLPGEVTTTLWKKTLRFAAEQELPVVFVVLPTRARGGKTRTAKAGGVSALARGCGVPAIVVDADDAVAIYRVAQESIGHARIGGGAALMECVPFVLEGAAARRAGGNDGVAELERHLVQRGAATRAWMEREAKRFAKQLTT